MRVLLAIFLLTSPVWGQGPDIGSTYVDASDDDYHSDLSPNPSSARYVSPKTRHLRQLYRQYTRRGFEYRGLAEKYYAKDQGEQKHYGELAKQYERKAMDIAQQLQDIETGGANPPAASPRIERRKVSQEKVRVRRNEKEQVGCTLRTRIGESTWQMIPSSTGIGQFPTQASNRYYRRCADISEYDPYPAEPGDVE